MRVHGLALVAAAALVIAALLSSVPEVSAVRVGPAPLAGQTSNRRGASSSPAPEQSSRKPAGNANGAAAASFDNTSRKPAAAAGGSSVPPSTVFDPDRMSKRRVRRGSDPIHNKC